MINKKDLLKMEDIYPFLKGQKKLSRRELFALCKRVARALRKEATTLGLEEK